MGEALSGTQAALPIRQQQQQPASDNDNQPTPATTATFGHSLLQQFPFDPAYRNMNNGRSFSTNPMDYHISQWNKKQHQLTLSGLLRLLRLHPQSRPGQAT